MEIKTVSLKTTTIPEERKLLPGLNMTQEELIARVRKAEEGPFYTLEEVKQKMQEWKALKFNPAIEGGELTIDEFKAMVKKAEEGPFYTLEEGQEMVRQWREQRRNR